MGPQGFLLKLQVTDSNWLAFSSPPKLCQRCRNGDPFVDLPATQRLGYMPRFSACFQLKSIQIVPYTTTPMEGWATAQQAFAR